MIVSTTCVMFLSRSFLLLVLLSPVTSSADNPDTRPFWTEQAVVHCGNDEFRKVARRPSGDIADLE